MVNMFDWICMWICKNKIEFGFSNFCFVLVFFDWVNFEDCLEIIISLLLLWLLVDLVKVCCRFG